MNSLREGAARISQPKLRTMATQSDIQLTDKLDMAVWVMNFDGQPLQGLPATIDNDDDRDDNARDKDKEVEAPTEFEDDIDEEVDERPANSSKVTETFEAVIDMNDVTSLDTIEHETPPSGGQMRTSSKRGKAAEKKQRQRATKRLMRMRPCDEDCECDRQEPGEIPESSVGSPLAADEPGYTVDHDQDATGTRIRRNSAAAEDQAPTDCEATLCMATIIIWSAMCATTLAAIGNIQEGIEGDKELMMAEESSRPGVRSPGFMTRLKAKLEKMVKVKKGFTVDSGAADHVMPLGWLAWILVTASLGSMRGLHYVSASGNRLPNKGEQKVKFLTRDGIWATLLFQVAGINKPLVSVSRLIDEGWRVVFDD